MRLKTVVFQKEQTYRNKKLLSLAKGQSCVCCGSDNGTTIPAHSNFEKGMGIKSSDSTVMFLCARCHDALDVKTDMSREEKVNFCYEMNSRTLRRLLESGLIVVK